MNKFKIGDLIAISVPTAAANVKGEFIYIATIIDIAPNEMLLKVKWDLDGVETDINVDDDIYKLEDLEKYTKDIKFDL